MKIFIKNANVLPMTGVDKILPRSDILIKNGRIAKIAQNLKADSNAKIINARNMVAMPGLINTHTHAAMVLFRGLADDLPLRKWLEEKIWPAEAELTEEDVYFGSSLGIMEMLKGGVTCFNDMYWFVEGTAEAVKQSGIRAVLNGVLVGIVPNAEQDFEKAILDVKKWHPSTSLGARGRIKMIFAPHALYSCPPKYLKKILKEAKKLKTMIHIHLAETMQGKGDIEKAAELGVFDLPTIAAHCVWVSEKEIDILKKYKVAVAHCPVSNLKLASGIAPVWQMVRKGILVALGTDGAASNNTLDMWETMKLAALLAKVKENEPTALPAYQVLKMATINGARALGLEKEIGTLEVGKKADIILINLKKPHFIPLHNIVSHLVYVASKEDVDTVIVDGKILVKGGCLIGLDEQKIINEVEKRADKIKEEIK